MQFLMDQWMAIVVSAVLVFIASFLTHMVLPLHKGEFKKLVDEDGVMNTVSTVSPGLYMFPCVNNASEMNSPEFKAKVEKVPNGLLVVWPGGVNMGQNLGLTLLFYLVVGVFVAYIGTHAIPESAAYLTKFRLCGAVAFCAHGLGWMSFFIWYRYGKFWPNFVDSLIYALVTAGTFAWLWK
ncbi:MAG TPA: hypothetical protein PKA27_05645 [Fimbriimonadaceae bacterium]|nr:hypothetical protein [Fimbriimonadaceae bacterium]